MARSPSAAGRSGGGSRPPRPPARPGAGAAAAGPVRGAAREVDPPKPKVSIPEFAGQVRTEGRKITWPTRKETWITSVFVGVFVLMAAVLFALVDGALSFLLQNALDLVNR